MGKASFSQGFAKEKLAEGRAPMVAKMETDSTIINLETSFPMDRAWKVHLFLMQIADEKIEPIDAFKKAFEENK
jgi:hypothetical protein